MNNAFTGYVSNRIMSVISGIPGGPPIRVDFTSGYVDSFQDSFNTKYDATDTMSNSDQMKHYTNTPRSISITIQLVAENINFARSNMQNISKLAQLCYPTLKENAVGSLATDGTPKVKIKIMNLVCDARTRGFLPGFIENLNYDFDLKEGVFEISKGEIYPKYIKLSFTFTPEHAHIMGYRIGDSQTGEGDSETGFQSFPYGVGGVRALKTNTAAQPEAQAGGPSPSPQNPDVDGTTLTPEQINKREQNQKLMSAEQWANKLNPSQQASQNVVDRFTAAGEAIGGFFSGLIGSGD
jgi:hypothetical protein